MRARSHPDAWKYQRLPTWRVLMPPYEKPDFKYVWHDGGTEADRQGWRRFLEVVAEQQRARYPDAVYVHCARYDRAVISRYAMTFRDTGYPVVGWLLEGGGLFDLPEGVVGSVVLPTYGNVLKEVCKD